MYRSLARPFLLVLVACLPMLTQAQSKTLMYDHVHIAVADPQAAAQWYLENIGGEFINGRTDRLLFGTTRIMFLQGENVKPSAGSVVDHLGFSVPNLTATVSKLQAAGATSEGDIRDVPNLFKLAFLVDPWGVRLEMLEDPQHLGFHHLHLRSPDPEVTFKWYEDTFGGVRTNLRGRLDGILYPGNVWLLITRGDSVPSKGTAINHIGWRAPETESTVADLTAKGVSLTSGAREMMLPNGMIEFFYVAGPDGARVELVQRAPDMR